MSDFEVSDIGTVEKLQVRIGRLEKKIKKLKQQRDHYKEQHSHYAHIIEMQPYIERRWTSYTERVEREKQNKQNANTVEEQSKLISLLMKENEQLRNQLTDATKV